jgi:hypothetical protein
MSERLRSTLSRADGYRNEGLWRYAAGAYLEAAGDCENIAERLDIVRQAEYCLTLYACQQAGVQLAQQLAAVHTDPRRI